MDELQVFSILDREKLFKIMKIFDESIVNDQFRSPKINNLKELGFTHKQSRDIIGCFFNFYLGLQHPDEIRGVINQVNIKEDTKQLIMEAFEAVIEKGDKKMVEIAEKSDILGKFGHEHLYHFQAVPEFRPILVNNKLQKMIMSIIIEGYAHNADHTKVTPINFQTDLMGLENLIQELNKQLEYIRTGAKILKEKLGDDVVNV